MMFYMKRKFFNLSFGLLSVFLLVSCIDNDYDDIYVSYGVIKNVNSKNDYEILTDKGNTLIVSKSYTSQKIENDKRVLVNYELLSDDGRNKNAFEVKVNGFYSLLSKPFVNESFILQKEEHRRDSIGNDPFNEIYTWFGGDFLNINFDVYHSRYSGKSHMINLIYDDIRSDSDTIYLTLRHNAYGEVPGKVHDLYRGIGRSSFKIADLLPDGVTSKAINITWLQYEDYSLRTKEYSKTAIFKLGDTADADKSTFKNAGFDTSIEIN